MNRPLNLSPADNAISAKSCLEPSVERNMKLLFLIPVLLASLALVGCGGGGGDSGTAPSTSTPPPDTGTLPPDPPPDTGTLPPDPPPDTGTLPPDPGEDGMQTLEGIDSDNDGVRDDVQIAIHAQYPNAAPSVMNALMQDAKSIQSAVLAGDTLEENAVEEAIQSTVSAVNCLHERIEDTTSAISFIQYQTINTPARSDAYIKFNEALSGRIFGTDNTSGACDQ